MQRLAFGFIKALTAKCLDRPDEPEHKALLEDFVRDVLVHVGRPEWPAAPLVAERLGTCFCQRLSQGAKERDEGGARLKAKDKRPPTRATRRRGCSRSSSSARSSPPSTSTSGSTRRRRSLPQAARGGQRRAQPTDEGEVTACVCGVAYDERLGFMLDCDLCHRWFHGACVGVPSDEKDLPEQWYCDQCRLSTAVADQRQRMARLLNLSSDASAGVGGGGGGDDVEGDDALPHDEGAGLDAERAGELAALCTETETTKQLILNFLQTNANADVAANAAQGYVLCEWHAAARDERKGLLCDLYGEQHAGVLAARRRLRQRSGEAVERKRALLSRLGVLMATRRLMGEGGLYGKAETMLQYLLSVLKDAQPSARAKAVKALRDVVKADPATLCLSGVKASVQHALRDPSIAVREGTLDLLGQYLASRPEFVQTYYYTIVSRLADNGVSVRKRVVKILREVCVSRAAARRRRGRAAPAPLSRRHRRRRARRHPQRR